MLCSACGSLYTSVHARSDKGLVFAVVPCIQPVLMSGGGLPLGSGGEEAVETWSIERVGEWLRSSDVGLPKDVVEEVVTKFEVNEVRGETLLQLETADLKEMEISLLARRKTVRPGAACRLV